MLTTLTTATWGTPTGRATAVVHYLAEQAEPLVSTASGCAIGGPGPRTKKAPTIPKGCSIGGRGPTMTKKAPAIPNGRFIAMTKKAPTTPDHAPVKNSCSTLSCSTLGAPVSVASSLQGAMEAQTAAAAKAAAGNKRWYSDEKLNDPGFLRNMWAKCSDMTDTANARARASRQELADKDAEFALKVESYEKRITAYEERITVMTEEFVPKIVSANARAKATRRELAAKDVDSALKVEFYEQIIKDMATDSALNVESYEQTIKDMTTASALKVESYEQKIKDTTAELVKMEGRVKGRMCTIYAQQRDMTIKNGELAWANKCHHELTLHVNNLLNQNSILHSRLAAVSQQTGARP
jgi:hypothetical protein